MKTTPRYQHVRFHKLNIGEDFFFRRFRYTKTAYFIGRTVLDGRAIAVMPWTRVRSARPFGKVRPPQTVTPGGDRRSETIGGNEKCPSS